MRTSKSNDRGFTLVELMVAMLVTLISLFALLKGLEVGADVNMKNLQREQAAQIASDQMAYLRALPFATTFSPYTAVPNRLRGATGAPPFRVNRSAVALSPTSKTVVVHVAWTYRNISSVHEVQSVVNQ